MKRFGQFLQRVTHHGGQTMTEYALILAAIAIVVYITYQAMGQNIQTLVDSVDSALTTT